MTAFRLTLAGAYFSLALTPALAEEARNFDIPAQPLSSAINTLSQQSGLHVFYADSTVQGRESAAVNGTYTPKQALSRMLSGSGVQAVSTAEDTIALKATAPAFIKTAAETSGSETTLPKVTVEAEADTDPYDPVDISNPNNKSYAAANATVGTKMNIPVMETPYSVKVVPQQVLKDQQATQIEDAVKNVAGVLPSWTNGGQSDVFIMRGFQNTNIYKDGFLLPSALGGGTAKRQIANIDRIEVLKGPGSILFGRNEPGGTINIVTKRPLATPYYSLQQQFASFDYYRTTADATGPITQDDTLLYRVNLSYQNSGSFRDFVKNDDVFFAPSLTWNISDRTQANMDIEYQHFDDTSDSGVIPMGTRPAPVPINRQLGDPFNNRNRGDRTYVNFNWSHEFNDNWKLSHRFGAEFVDKEVNFTFFFGQPDNKGNLVNVTPDFSAGNRGYNNGLTNQQNYYTTLNLTGKFNTGPLEHSTLWGFDYFVIDNQDKGTCCAAYRPGQTFNIFHPIYQTGFLPFQFNYLPVDDFTQDWYGLYFQDQIKFPFNIYGNFGIRYDNAVGRNNLTKTVTTEDDKVSPRGGLLWQPMKWLSLYGSYSENFGATQSLFNGPGQGLIPPQTADQWELGAKTEFFDGRLNASFAYFDLTKKNVSFTDFGTRIPFTKTIGEQESRGYEFEVSGEVLPGWNVIAAYTHMPFANVIKDGLNGSSGDTGKRMFNTPRNFGSLWTTYEFLNGSMQGLKFGGGVYASSASFGSNANDYQLPGYATLNLLASYSMKLGKSKVTAQLNANNLLDKTYYLGSNTGNMIGVAQPRNFMGSIKVEF